jgi:hypothetical protein
MAVEEFELLVIALYQKLNQERCEILATGCGKNWCEPIPQITWRRLILLNGVSIRLVGVKLIYFTTP